MSLDTTILQALDEVFTEEAREPWLKQYFSDRSIPSQMERDLLAAAYVRRLCIEDVSPPA